MTLKNNAQGGRVGTVDFTQADGKKYVYYTSEAEDAKLSTRASIRSLIR